MSGVSKCPLPPWPHFPWCFCQWSISINSNEHCEEASQRQVTSRHTSLQVVIISIYDIYYIIPPKVLEYIKFVTACCLWPQGSLSICCSKWLGLFSKDIYTKLNCSRILGHRWNFRWWVVNFFWKRAFLLKASCWERPTFVGELSTDLIWGCRTGETLITWLIERQRESITDCFLYSK